MKTRHREVELLRRRYEMIIREITKNSYRETAKTISEDTVDK